MLLKMAEHIYMGVGGQLAETQNGVREGGAPEEEGGPRRTTWL